MLLKSIISKFTFAHLKPLKSFLLLVIIASCNVPHWYKPYGYMTFKHLPKNGSPGFTLGWIHGCESGLGTQFGGAIYQTFYTWHRDVDITSSNPNVARVRARYSRELRGVNWNDPNDIKSNFSDYNKVFWKSHIFCRHSVLGILQTAGYTPNNPGESRFDFEKHGVGGVFSISGAGDSRIGKSSSW